MRTRFKWHRLLTNPTTRIVAREDEVTTLQVEGLVCSSVCAVRTRQALEDLDGVRRVRVDFETGIATIEGAPHEAAEYERAVAGVIVGKPLRRLIEHINQLLRRRTHADQSFPKGTES
jgi:copper chaperone CopZ